MRTWVVVLIVLFGAADAWAAPMVATRPLATAVTDTARSWRAW
ncbi:hypothetical protein ACFV2H_11115 [Streptomyces sp. NPDC059629]